LAGCFGLDIMADTSRSPGKTGDKIPNEVPMSPTFYGSSISKVGLDNKVGNVVKSEATSCNSDH
jgi:hypothetical protein